MRTTLTGPVPPFVGADLSDRYSEECRPTDMCGLVPEPGGLRPQFWLWEWDGPDHALDAAPVAAELEAANVAVLDAPQGLAAPTRTMRACERKTGAPGKSGEQRPPLEQPFATYIWSSLDLFASLASHGLSLFRRTGQGQVGEIFPGYAWSVLAGSGLPKKGSVDGRRARAEMLRAMGVLLEDGVLPTHDQNDACLAAVTAAAARGHVPGLSLQTVGDEPYVDGRGQIREGLMVVPTASGPLAEKLRAVARAFPPPARPSSPTARRESRARDPGSWPACPADSLPLPVAASPEARAEQLLETLTARAHEGKHVLVTYGWAHKAIFGPPAGAWSQAYARQVTDIASRTSARPLPSLREVRLDAFIVAKGTGLPGTAHWDEVDYTPQQWLQAFEGACLLSV